jgi:riboflavin kinase/FMN adenylyltransferase
MRSKKRLVLDFSSSILTGEKLGRTIGFPTINLNPQVFTHPDKPGVYACTVQLSCKAGATSPKKPTQSHLGALYFGPRLVKNETQNVLEVFLLDFEGDVYGHMASVQLLSFIRPPIKFPSFEEMRDQLEKDIAQVRAYLNFDANFTQAQTT